MKSSRPLRVLRGSPWSLAVMGRVVVVRNRFVHETLLAGLGNAEGC